MSRPLYSSLSFCVLGVPCLSHQDRPQERPASQPGVGKCREVAPALGQGLRRGTTPQNPKPELTRGARHRGWKD